jgi:hypothetical protein
LPIDKDEEAGLRAFAIDVEAYAGASSPERPLRIRLNGGPLDVVEVLAQWREEERLGYRVSLSDGSGALLYYVPELDLWSGVIERPGRLDLVRREPA